MATAASWWSFDYLKGMIVVSLSLLFLIILGLTASPVGGSMPFFGLIPIFFFSLLRPKQLPYWLLFFSGILVESLQGLPIGMYALLFILFSMLARKLSRHFYRKTVWIFWIGFVLCSLGFWMTSWLMFTALSGNSLPYSSVLIPWLVTAAFYPLLHLLLLRLLPFIPILR